MQARMVYRTTRRPDRLIYMIVVLIFLTSLLSFTAPLTVWSEERSPKPFGLADRVIEHQLVNGLTVLLVERHEAPVVSINLTFRAGGLDERTGQTGVAHLFEHMAFKGTQTIGTKNFAKEKIYLEKLERLNQAITSMQQALHDEGQSNSPELQSLQQQFTAIQQQADELVVSNEMSLLYQRHGAVGLNASTGKDVTRYTVSLPSNRLPLWAAIETDRMSKPVLREFYKERAVVMEERRLRTEDNPAGLLYEAFAAAAFQAHPYGLPTVGWASDIQSLTPSVTKKFFETYYSPANAVVSLVGDIDPQAVISLVERTMGQIPTKPLPPRVETIEPLQRGERRIEVEYDAEPMVFIGYHKPSLNHPDDFVFDVIDALLSQGVTSRLYHRVVREKRVATSVGTQSSVPGARAPNLFTVSAVPLAPHTTQEVEEAIYEELNRLKTEPVKPKELEKVLNNLDASLIRSLRSNSGLASQLAYFQAVADDWRYMVEARKRVAAVTPEDIQRVATIYLTKSNRTVATLVKPEQLIREVKNRDLTSPKSEGS